MKILKGKIEKLESENTKLVEKVTVTKTELNNRKREMKEKIENLETLYL